MITLIPVEAWEYSLIDAIKSISVLLNKNKLNHFRLEGFGDSFPVRSGRLGLLIALRAIGLKENSRIGVPLYCCPVVFKAIKMAGYKPVFIDVDNDYCISITDLSNKAQNLDALIAVHMFGHVCNMPAIIEIMKEKPVIEDAAQSLGSLLNGRPAGLFGQISVFSFRSGKYLTAGEGGALVVNQEFYKEPVRSLIESMKEPGLKEEIIHIAKTFLRTELRTKPLWGLLGLPLWKLYNRKVNFLAKTPIISGGAFLSDLTTMERRKYLLPAMINRQRQNADFYLKNLSLPQEFLSLEPLNSFYNRFMFPLRLRTPKEADFIFKHLLTKNISTSRPYLEVPEAAYLYYGYQRDCPVAENLLRTTLVIPVHYRLSRKDLTKITDSLNRALEKLANHK